MTRTQNALGAATIAAFAVLGGCASNRTYILQPAPQATSLKTVSIKAIESTIEVMPEDRAEFEKVLSKKLSTTFASDPAAPSDLVVQYRFVLNDKGNTVHRVGSNVLNLVGSPFYGFGDGVIGVEVVYMNRSGAPLAHIVVDGTLSGAFGNTSDAIDEAADSIAKYAKANFAAVSDSSK